MQGIEVTLKRNKQYVAENKEEYEIISGENNATTILVHFPEEYKDFSKRVDFKNIKNEKWSIGLYTPEDETKKYGADFDKLNFAFTLPTPVTVNGELQIQFIAYLADDTETFVPFKLFKIVVEDSIMYVKKQGSENPDLIIQTYEYANMALEISRDAFDRIENAERAALEAEKSAKSAQTSANSAQTSATNAKNSAISANTRAVNAEASAKAAQESAEYAEQVADGANTKSDQAVATSNSANTKSDNAVSTANSANTKSNNAVSTANTALTNSQNAVSTSNTANSKSDNAVEIATEAKGIAEESNEIASSANTKSDNAVATANTANTKSTNAVNTANTANTKSDNAVTTANEAKTSATSAVTTANNANTKSDNAVSVSNSANTKSNNAVNTASEAKATAEEALKQVVEKMGTKVFLGTNTTPEANMTFSSDPQTQINQIKNNTTIVANSSGGFSCGSGATNGKGMQFKGFTICDENGKIPVARLFDAIYPVGSIYISTNSTNPGTLFGGTWEAYAQGRTLIGNGTSDQTFTAGATGGASTHTLTTAQMPSHTHTQNSHGHSGNNKSFFYWFSQFTHRDNQPETNFIGCFKNSDNTNVTLSQMDYNNNTDAIGSGSRWGYRKVGVSWNHTPSVNDTTATNNNTGGGGSHNNLQPYIVTYIWRRTA